MKISNYNIMGWKWSCTILRYYYNTGLTGWKESQKFSVSMHLGSDSKLTPSQHEVWELMAICQSGSKQKCSEK